MLRELAKRELKAVSGGAPTLTPQQTCASVGLVVGSVAFTVPSNTTAMAGAGTAGVTLGVTGTVTVTEPTSTGVTITCVPPAPPPTNCGNSTTAPVKTGDASQVTTGEGELAGGPGDDGGGGGNREPDDSETGVC